VKVHSDRDIYRFIGMVLRKYLREDADEIICIAEPWSTTVSIDIKTIKDNVIVASDIIDAGVDHESMFDLMNLFLDLKKYYSGTSSNFDQAVFALKNHGTFSINFFKIPIIEGEMFQFRSDEIFDQWRTKQRIS
jgi:hypothetical protein